MAMYELPEKARKLVPYQPLSGSFTMRLDANESFLDTPDWLREEITQAVSTVAFNRYPDPYAAELCAKFATFFGVDPAHVVAGNGSDELIGIIISAFAQSGDTLLTVSPDFSMYAFYAQMNGVNVSVFDKWESGLMLHADAFIACAKERDAKIVILSNPCNPTSLAASREDVLKIAAALPDRLVVIDEAYMDFWEGSVLGDVAQHDNLVVLKTCSKAFGMAAIRLGFSVACKTLSDVICAAKSPYNVNSMTQAAGCVLFSHPDYLIDCTGAIKRSRTQLYKMLAQLDQKKEQIRQVYHTKTNFVLLLADDPERIRAALAERGIAVRALGQTLRISAGSEQENAAVLSAMDEILR